MKVNNEEKSLLVVKENFLTRIFSYLKRKFKKQKQIAEVSNVTIMYKQEKKDIFDLYADLKSRTIKADEIEESRLEKIKILLKEEVKLKKKRLEQLLTEAEMQGKSIENIERKLENV